MSLLALLSEPFGPYLDEFLLSDNCKTTKTQVLCLRCLMLERSGKPTGLTETDPLNPELRPKDPVRFRGVLEIKSLSWLSLDGQEQLQKDVRKRDCARNDRHKSGLTLQSIYGPAAGRGSVGLKLKVWIQGMKSMSAGYMTSDLVPDGLLLTTKDRTRKYAVVDMDVETYIRSEIYLDRYLLLNVLHQIVDKDSLSTPVEKRDISYFVKGYIANFAYLEANKKRRLLHKSDDEEGEEGEEEESHLHLRRPRVLRRVHQAEVLKCFAAQADWILEEQEMRQKHKRIANLDLWQTFIAKVSINENPAVSAEYYDASDANEDDNVVQESKPASSANAKGKHRALNAPVRMQEHVKRAKFRHYQGNDYDDDFSEESSSSASSSHNGHPPPGRSSSIEPDLHLLYPSWGAKEPVMGEDCQWSCPEEDCSYYIDLLQVPEEHGLERSQLRFLKGKKWVLNDEGLTRIFYDMVKDHWVHHLHRNMLELTDECKVKRISSCAPEDSSVRRSQRLADVDGGEVEQENQ